MLLGRDDDEDGPGVFPRYVHPGHCWGKCSMDMRALVKHPMPAGSKMNYVLVTANNYVLVTAPFVNDSPEDSFKEKYSKNLKSWQDHSHQDSTWVPSDYDHPPPMI